jgi:hypothetical protein
MKILIIARYFPPENTIGALRPYSWAKYWSRENHDITVLTINRQSYVHDLVLDCSNFKIVKASIPFVTKGNYIVNLKNTSDTIKKKKWYVVFVSSIRQFLLDFSQKTGCFSIRFPSFDDLWAINAFRTIKPFQFDIVVSTGGPYSVHKIGLLLKRKYPAIKWIIDWRDLWTKNHIFTGLKIFHGYEHYLENKFHKNADLITTVSEPLAEILRTITKTRVEIIYNGFDNEDYDEIMKLPRKTNQEFTIVYTGTIYRKYRDPSPLFEAISNLNQIGALTKHDLRILFAGSTTSDVSDLAVKYGIMDYYSFLGRLPRESALQLQYDADAVLFLEYDDSSVRGILSGKIFEYIYAAREILAVGTGPDTDVGEIIINTETGVSVGYDVKAIEKYLISRIIQKEKKTNRKNMETINVYSRKVQALKMLELIVIYRMGKIE